MGGWAFTHLTQKLNLSAHTDVLRGLSIRTRGWHGRSLGGEDVEGLVVPSAKEAIEARYADIDARISFRKHFLSADLRFN